MFPLFTSGPLMSKVFSFPQPRGCFLSKAMCFSLCSLISLFSNHLILFLILPMFSPHRMVWTNPRLLPGKVFPAVNAQRIFKKKEGTYLVYLAGLDRSGTPGYVP